MFEKILISAVVSLLIFQVMNFINSRRQNKILFEINKCILQSAMMYFSNTEIQEAEMDKFQDFVKSRISDNKLDEWVSNFTVKLIDANKLNISYQFRRSESHLQNIAYEIKKNIHPLAEDIGDEEETENDKQ